MQKSFILNEPEGTFTFALPEKPSNQVKVKVKAKVKAGTCACNCKYCDDGEHRYCRSTKCRVFEK